MQPRINPSVAVVILVAGCQDSASFSVSASGPEGAAVHVDTRCDNGGCNDPRELKLVVSANADNNPQGSVEILQYRVDYELTDVDDAVPYFAAAANLNVPVDEPATFHTQAAGSRQRDWIIQRYGFDRVEGTATITLAGYNDEDETQTAEDTFDIQFGDFDASDEDGGADMDGGTP